jgi:hypothetical protein
VDDPNDDNSSILRDMPLFKTAKFHPIKQAFNQFYYRLKVLLNVEKLGEVRVVV